MMVSTFLNIAEKHEVVARQHHKVAKEMLCNPMTVK
jgi:hypothetical protein